jgi:hypothetical protein
VRGGYTYTRGEWALRKKKGGASSTYTRRPGLADLVKQRGPKRDFSHQKNPGEGLSTAKAAGLEQTMLKGWEHPALFKFARKRLRAPKAAFWLVPKWTALLMQR